MKTPIVIMYAIRKIPKNIPDFSSLTYWKEELCPSKEEEIIKVTFESLEGIGK